MDNFFEALSNLIGGIIATAILGGSILLLAGEIRLATLRKASQGSAKLSNFTQRMTKTQFLLSKGSLHGTNKKPEKAL